MPGTRVPFRADRPASQTPLAAIRNQIAPQFGTLAVLASTTTGEVADTTSTPAGARIGRPALFRTRSTLDA